MPKMSNLDRMKQSQAAKRTNLADWWASQEEELDLPSGLHVVVRDVDLEDLIASGSIPNTLLAVFPELQGLSDEEASKKMLEEHPQSFADFLDLIVMSCLVEPRVGDVTDPENGIIALRRHPGQGQDVPVHLVQPGCAGGALLS